MSLKLKDIIRELIARGKHEEAQYYRVVVPFDLGLLHDIDEDKVLDMTVDAIEVLYRLPPKPDKYEGWNFYWGKAAFGEDDSSRNR